jgi:beta-fructofuranosidase
MPASIPIPRLDGGYTRVYRPAGDHYHGTPTPELTPGTWYPDWVPNDHGFVCDTDGRWHVFGITHPLTGSSLERVHDGEVQSFHARAPRGSLAAALRADAWEDLPKVLLPRDRPGEIPEQHAPAIVRRDGTYWMIYGPSPLRLATSSDLHSWTPAGALFSEATGARDPGILLWNNLYHMVFCSLNQVRLRTSPDLRHWSTAETLLTLPPPIAPESPFLVLREGIFYLFVCGWDGVWDQRDLQGAYQHRTYVYAAADLHAFGSGPPLTELEAHAPEVIAGEDGQWYLSSAEWPERGISLAKLAWETTP